MAIKQLYGDRDHNRGIVKNFKFTVFADLAAATAAVGTVFGFAYITTPGALYYNQNGLAWQPIGTKGLKGDTGATGPQGPVGPIGPDGPAGAAGTHWYVGSGAPVTLYNDGDFYIDTLTGDVYEQAAGTWSGPVMNITGSQGPIGPAGPPGPIGPEGPSGASGADGTFLIVDNGHPDTHTSSGVVDPTAAPAPGITFYFNTVALTFWVWDATNLVWVRFPISYYIDRRSNVMYAAVAGAWGYSSDLATPRFPAPIYSATGAITRESRVLLVPVDSSGGPITLTLFAAPTALLTDSVKVKDIAGAAAANPITVAAPGGTKLNGTLAGTVVIDQAFGEVTVDFFTVDTNPSTTPVTGWWTVTNVPGLPWVQTISAATALARFRRQVALLDSSGGAFTLTLPASPQEEDTVEVKDSTGDCEEFPVTLAGTFEDAAPVVDGRFQSLILVFRGGVWRVAARYDAPVAAPVSVTAATVLTAKRIQTILYNATGGAFAIDLPTSPRENDRVRLKEVGGSTNVLTVTGTVDGVVNPTISVAYAYTAYEYLNGAWRRMS